MLLSWAAPWSPSSKSLRVRKLPARSRDLSRVCQVVFVRALSLRSPARWPANSYPRGLLAAYPLVTKSRSLHACHRSLSGNENDVPAERNHVDIEGWRLKIDEL